MATINIGDVLRIVDNMTVYGQKIMNIYHTIVEGEFGIDATTVVTAIRSWLDVMHGEIDESIADALSFDYCSVFNVTQDLDHGTSDMVVNTDGDSTGDALPLQCAGVIRFPTATPGSQGRKFLCGFSEESSAAGGTVQAVALARMTAAAADMLNGWSVSGRDGITGNYNYVLEEFRPWLSALVNSDFGTQRRRVKGVGI